jgi:hypothetical protein
MHSYLVIGYFVVSSILRLPKKQSKISYQNIKDIQCSAHGLESHSCTYFAHLHVVCRLESWSLQGRWNLENATIKDNQTM